MAITYDPVTGLPKQQQSNTGFNANAPLFEAAPGALGTGATGFNATTGAGSGATPTSPYGNLQDDPMFRQLNADLSAQGIQDLAGAQAATRRGLILFGEVPPLDPKFLPESWVDEPTRQLAAQNTASGMSMVARMAKTNKDQIRALKNVLAARGALQSGELGHQLGEEDLRYRTGQYDARQQLTDYLAGIQSAWAQGERARAGARAAGAGEAAGRLPPAPPPPPTTTPPVAPPTWTYPPPSPGHDAPPTPYTGWAPPVQYKPPPPPPPTRVKDWFG